MKPFFDQLKRVKAREILQAWKLPVAAVAALFYRQRHKDLWIVCEEPIEARDNGYWFFKHVRERHPEQECVYAISSKSPDIDKIRGLGEWVEFGSLKHWILYLASARKISSQKAGNPNAAVFYFLEVYGILKDSRIFLQHGVTINDLTWLYYEETKMRRFLCGAYPEYKFIRERFGYPKGSVRYTGLCRFDGLHDFRTDRRLILIMPSWRLWIANEDYRLQKYEGTTVIPKTEYFRQWNSFLSDRRLQLLSQTYGVRFIFFPHRNMQKYMRHFPKTNAYLEIADGSRYDVQELMKRAAMMVTDYSSVFFDMLYMKKPVVFYQFDYEKFREAQYAEGYFDYRDNPFAKSFPEKQGVFDEIERLIGRDFLVDEDYLRAHKKYFPLYDKRNSERVFQVIKDLSDPGKKHLRKMNVHVGGS